jgi:hypothetical protein
MSLKNASKVIGAASHCLYDNPCRRFIYALTIEDDSAKAWCFTRSRAVVSERFNFLQVRSVLFFMNVT